MGFAAVIRFVFGWLPWDSVAGFTVSGFWVDAVSGGSCGFDGCRGFGWSVKKIYKKRIIL